MPLQGLIPAIGALIGRLGLGTAARSLGSSAMRMLAGRAATGGGAGAAGAGAAGAGATAGAGANAGAAPAKSYAEFLSEAIANWSAANLGAGPGGPGGPSGARVPSWVIDQAKAAFNAQQAAQSPQNAPQPGGGGSGGASPAGPSPPAPLPQNWSPGMNASFGDIMAGKTSMSAVAAEDERRAADQEAAAAAEEAAKKIRTMAKGGLAAGLVLIALPSLIDRFGGALVRKAEALEQFGGVQAVEAQRLEANRIGRQVELAAVTADSGRDLFRAKNRMEEAMMPMKELKDVALNKIGTVLLTAASTVVEGVNAVISIIPGLSDIIEEQRRKAEGALNPVVEFLDALADRPNVGASGAGRRRLPTGDAGGAAWERPDGREALRRGGAFRE